MPYYHISVRRDTISLFLPLTILMSSVILKTVYHETVLIRYLTIVKLRSHLLGLPKKDRVSSDLSIVHILTFC